MGADAFRKVRNLKETRAFRRFRRNRPAPVDPLDQQRELRRGQMQRAVDNRRPDEASLLKTLVPPSEVQPLPPQMSSLWVSRTRFTHYSSGSCAAWASDTIAMASGFCFKPKVARFGRFLCDGRILRTLILKS